MLSAPEAPAFEGAAAEPAGEALLKPVAAPAGGPRASDLQCDPAASTSCCLTLYSTSAQMEVSASTGLSASSSESSMDLPLRAELRSTETSCATAAKDLEHTAGASEDPERSGTSQEFDDGDGQMVVVESADLAPEQKPHAHHDANTHTIASAVKAAVAMLESAPEPAVAPNSPPPLFMACPSAASETQVEPAAAGAAAVQLVPLTLPKARNRVSAQAKAAAAMSAAARISPAEPPHLHLVEFPIPRHLCVRSATLTSPHRSDQRELCCELAHSLGGLLSLKPDANGPAARPCSVQYLPITVTRTVRVAGGTSAVEPVVALSCRPAVSSAALDAWVAQYASLAAYQSTGSGPTAIPPPPPRLPKPASSGVAPAPDAGMRWPALPVRRSPGQRRPASGGSSNSAALAGRRAGGQALRVNTSLGTVGHRPYGAPGSAGLGAASAPLQNVRDIMKSHDISEDTAAALAGLGMLFAGMESPASATAPTATAPMSASSSSALLGTLPPLRRAARPQALLGVKNPVGRPRKRPLLPFLEIGTLGPAHYQAAPPPPFMVALASGAPLSIAPVMAPAVSSVPFAPPKPLVAAATPFTGSAGAADDSVSAAASAAAAAAAAAAAEARNLPASA